MQSLLPQVGLLHGGGGGARHPPGRGGRQAPGAHGGAAAGGQVTRLHYQIQGGATLWSTIKLEMS